MQSLVSSKPSVGPYWRASAEDSCAIFVICAANVSGGKVEVSGRPPASEITSGRAVIAIRSRIAEERIDPRALGEQPGVALEVARRWCGRAGCGGVLTRGVWSIRAAVRTARGAGPPR